MRVGGPGSLRWRLTAFVAIVVLASAALASLVVYIEAGSRLQGAVDHDLRGDVTQMAATLAPYARRPPASFDADARRYVDAQPYSATSTLLFVLLGGSDRVIANHPEVFGGPPDEGESAQEQAAENRAGAALENPRTGYSTQIVPDVGNVRILEQRLRLRTGEAVIGVGEPLAGVTAARRGITKALVLVAALSLLLALVASYLAGERVTAPLRRMAAVAARVDGGDLEPRMPSDPSRSSEVRVLADAFNRMLDRLAVAFDGQRAFIADASHELRTPLTLISGQLEVLAAADRPRVEEVARVERIVQAEISRMSRLTDDLLLLTAAGQAGFVRVEQIDLQPFVADLWGGLELTAERRFELGEIPEGTLRADPDRLAQALRNLARNAIEHTSEGTGLVAIEAQRRPGNRLVLAVLDDGPGISPAERERVFDRLYRIDLARSRRAGGSGLGLAIVRAIAEAHGGSARAVDPGPRGGARIELELPRWAGANAIAPQSS